MKMLYSISQSLIQLLLALSMFLNHSSAHDLRLKQRTLLGIKETPHGGNETFDCSPSGPCIPCARSEKGNEMYHCAETGYRIRLKCVPAGSGSKDAKVVKAQKNRSALEHKNSGVNQPNTDLVIPSTRQRLLDESSKSIGGSRSYVTYRSCIPAINEEKLSVLGFEALMLALLVSSGSFIYFRRKQTSVAGGVPVRLPTNSRF